MKIPYLDTKQLCNDHTKLRLQNNALNTHKDSIINGLKGFWGFGVLGVFTDPVE